MKFNSQVCTTIEQSKKLLELGLDPITADMFHTFDYTINRIVNPNVLQNPNQLEDLDIPAWSLHRLLEIGENSINLTEGKEYESIIDLIEFKIKENYKSIQKYLI